MNKVIAIDGPSGVGKSSVSKELARRLHWTYLDTGAMYRTVTLAWLQADTETHSYEDPDWLSRLDLDFQESCIYLEGVDVSLAIREPRVTNQVSKVAAEPKVRTFLTEMQRRIAGRRPCILDGRDIGTVVFPNAFLKVFLTASARVRAHRRWLQMGAEDASQTLEEVLRDQESRDHKDANRATAPLRRAQDAFDVDTDTYAQAEVVALLEDEVAKRKRFFV